MPNSLILDQINSYVAEDSIKNNLIQRSQQLEKATEPNLI